MKITNLYFNAIDKVYTRFVLSKKTPRAKEVLERIESSYIKILKMGRSCNGVIHNCELNRN